MRIHKDIKSLPWPDVQWGDQTLLRLHVRGQWYGEDPAARLLVLDFAEYRHLGGSRAFRVVIDAANRDFALYYQGVEKGGRGMRVSLRNGPGISVSYVYPDIDPGTEAMIKAVVHPSDGEGEVINHCLGNLENWMLAVIDERRAATRAASGEIPDNAVYTCPENIPDGLADWIRDEIRPLNSVMIYKSGGLVGTCALCGRKVRTTRSKKMRMYADIECPDCHRTVTCYLTDSNYWKRLNVENIIAAQRGEDGTVWFRQWHLRRDVTGKYAEGYTHYLEEIGRYAVRGRQAAKWVREAKYGGMYNREPYPLNDWARIRNYDAYDGTFRFFPGGLEEAIEGTVLAYADIPKFLRLYREQWVLKYILLFARYPVMEYFMRAGYTGIIQERVYGTAGKNIQRAVLWQRDSLRACVRFPLRFLRLKSPEDWTIADMRCMALAYKYGKSEHEYMSLFNQLSGLPIADDDMNIVSRYAPAAKTIAYLTKQRRRADAQDLLGIIHTYRDYTDECVKLKYDMSGREVIFPPNLFSAHTRTMGLVEYEENKEKIELFKRRVEALSALAWSSGPFLIRPAEGHSELKMEGKVLGHCVAGYADRMANGDTAIFLLRKVSAPDVPFYTLELRDKKVIQCRTKNNQPYDGEIKRFVAKWLTNVVNKSNKNKKNA